MKTAKSVRLRRIAAASIITLVMAPAASGYEGEVPATVTVTATGDVVPGEPIAISATVLGPSGTGVPDVTVTFTITVSPPGAHDVLTNNPTAMNSGLPTAVFAVYRSGAVEPTRAPVADHASVAQATTDANGVATVYLILDAVAGSRTITADAEGQARGTVTVILAPAGLPNTAVAFEPREMLGTLAIIFAVLAIFAAQALVHHRARRRGGNHS